MKLCAYGSGIVTLVVLWLLYKILVGKWNPWELIKGADGRPSASKLQFFLWTAVALFSYATILSARFYKGNYDAINEIPKSLLIAMGFSVVTMAAAKGITVSYVASGRADKTVAKPTTDAEIKSNADPVAKPKADSPDWVYRDDDGYPDLSKIQLIAWTLIALVIYLIRLDYQINAAPPILPDIDPALMVLMGLGQGAYLGKKLVSTDVPRLSGLSLGSGSPGTEINITGLSFGEEQNGSLLTIDGNPFQPVPKPDWHDSYIKLIIPLKQINGKDWPKEGQRISIGVIVNGQESANTLSFTITA